MCHFYCGEYGLIHAPYPHPHCVDESGYSWDFCLPWDFCLAFACESGRFQSGHERSSTTALSRLSKPRPAVIIRRHVYVYTSVHATYACIHAHAPVRKQSPPID